MGDERVSVDRSREWPAIVAAMRSVGYRWLWSTTLANNSGRFAVLMVAGWLAYRFTGSAAGAGLTSFLAFAPALVLGPIAGALADRVDRRRLIAAGAAVGASVCFLAAALDAAGRLGLPLVLFVALAAGVAVALEQPARTSLVPLLSAPQDMLNAFSLIRIPIQGAELVGPALATAALVGSGPAAALGVCGLFYLAGVLQAPRIGVPHEPARNERRPGGVVAEIRDGLRYVRQEPAIGRLLIWVGLH